MHVLFDAFASEAAFTFGLIFMDTFGIAIAFASEATFTFGLIFVDTFGIAVDIMNLAHRCFRLVLDCTHSVNFSFFVLVGSR